MTRPAGKVADASRRFGTRLAANTPVQRSRFNVVNDAHSYTSSAPRAPRPVKIFSTSFSACSSMTVPDSSDPLQAGEEGASLPRLERRQTPPSREDLVDELASVDDARDVYRVLVFVSRALHLDASSNATPRLGLNCELFCSILRFFRIDRSSRVVSTRSSCFVAVRADRRDESHERCRRSRGARGMDRERNGESG